MDGLNKALEYLVGTGERLGKGTTFRTDAEPPHVYYLNTADGPVRTEAAPKPDNHVALSLETIFQVGTDKRSDFENIEVWYSRTGVVCTYGPFGRTTFSLTPSPQLKELAKWDDQGRAVLKQTEFIIKLRTLFADCYTEHPNLLESVRRIDVKKGQDVSSEVRTGKVSMGRSMLAEITGLDKLPEVITFKVPVFAEASFATYKPVRVALDPDPVNEQFGFVVLPGDIERAYAGAEDELRGRIKSMFGDDNATCIYHGRP